MSAIRQIIERDRERAAEERVKARKEKPHLKIDIEVLPKKADKKVEWLQGTIPPGVGQSSAPIPTLEEWFEQVYMPKMLKAESHSTAERKAQITENYNSLLENPNALKGFRLLYSHYLDTHFPNDPRRTDP